MSQSLLSVFDNTLLLGKFCFISLSFHSHKYGFEQIVDFWTQNLTVVVFEPTHTFEYQRLKGMFFESGALDRSAIMSWVVVYRNCLGLFSITPSRNVKTASSCSSFDSHKNYFHLNIGFMNTIIDRNGIRTHAHVFVPEFSNWISLESDALDRSAILPSKVVYHNCFSLFSIRTSCIVKSDSLLLLWFSQMLLRTNGWLLEHKFWQERDSNPGTRLCQKFNYGFPMSLAP